VKEQKEPIPGWLITKVVKQPPLKEKQKAIMHEKPFNGAVKFASIETKKVVVRSLSYDNESAKQTVHDPKTNKIKTSADKKFDFNNNNTKTEKTSSVSEKIQQFTNYKGEKSSPKNGEERPEIEEILRNVRIINRNHLSRGNIKGINEKNPDQQEASIPTQFPSNSYDSNPLYNSVSTVSSTPSPPLYKDESISRDNCNKYDVNNNKTEKYRHRASSVDGSNESFNPSNNINPIKTIKISKKTLELNVKQFTQYKAEQKHNDKSAPDVTITHHHTSLKPLQLKFNFQVRKKKAYKEKQQTRSLTDIINGISSVETRPTEEQMLSPKHRCNDHCQLENGECKEKVDLNRGKIPHTRRTVIKPPRIQHYSFLSIPNSIAIPE